MDDQKENFTSATNKKSGSDSVTIGAMKIVQTTITSMGIVTNLIVVVVFLNNRKLRQKIPNICIINQVRNNFYCPQTKFGTRQYFQKRVSVILSTSHSVHRVCGRKGHAWQGACVAWGMHGGGCLEGGMHGRPGVFMAGGHAWQGGLCGRGCAWQVGLHDRGHACRRDSH